MSLQDTEWEELYQEVRTWNWFILFFLSGISYFLWNPSSTLGVIIGGLIVIGSFHLLQRSVREAFGLEGPTRKAKKKIILKYYFRLAALGILIYLVMKSRWIDPVGLVIGFSTVVLSIVGMGVRRAIKAKTGEAI